MTETNDARPQLPLGLASRGFSGVIHRIAAAEAGSALPDIELELIEQCRFRLPIPPPPERGEIIERPADGHPRVERDGIRHVREPLSNGASGLRVVRVLAALQRSLEETSRAARV